MKKWHIAVIGIVLLGIITAALYNGLVVREQQYRAGGGHYSVALDLCSQKIELIGKIYQTYLSQERTIIATWAEARSAFYQAASEGDVEETIEAVTNLQLNVKAVVEAYPVLSSVPVAQQTIGEMTEAVNEIKTASDDWVFATQNYNSARKSWPTVWAGNMFGFPGEFQYYQSDQAKLDVSEIPGLDLG